MADPVAVAEVVRDTAGHPAARAWAETGAAARRPQEIRVLKERSKGIRKSAVYWLAGAGPEGGHVVAKLMQRSGAAAESVIYTEVLSRLPAVSSLRFYGTVDTGGDFAWIFLEDAAGDRYSPASADHRRLAGRWLGALHASAAQLVPPATLPERGPRHFRTALRSGRAILEDVAAQPDATSGTQQAVTRLVTSLHLLEANWHHVVSATELLAPTLVHGDLIRKNVRVRHSGQGLRMLAYDWEEAGWGTAVCDLAQQPSSERLSLNACLGAYRDTLVDLGVEVPPEAVARSGVMGTVLRCVAAIAWLGPRLMVDQAPGTLRRVELYGQWLDHAMRIGGLQSEISTRG